MSGGPGESRHAEQEVRDLPGVVACSITPTRVAVLLEPSADPDDTTRQVGAILAAAGLSREVRVLGGSRAPAPALATASPTPARAGRAPGPVRPAGRRRRAPLVTGSAAGAAVLALGALVAALATGNGAPGSDNAASPSAAASRRPSASAPSTPSGATGPLEVAAGPAPAVTVLGAFDTGGGSTVGAGARPGVGRVQTIALSQVPTAQVASSPAAPSEQPTPPGQAKPAPAPAATPASTPPTVVVAGDDCESPPPPRSNRQSTKGKGPGQHGTSKKAGACDPPTHHDWPGMAGTPRH